MHRITQLRDLENSHNEKLLETCMLVLEKVVKNELDDELPEDLRMVSVSIDLGKPWLLSQTLTFVIPK